MNHIGLDKQDEAVKGFVLSLPRDPNGAVLELDGQPVAWIVAVEASDINSDDDSWTERKNDRRCALIDRKYSGGRLTPGEAFELALK